MVEKAGIRKEYTRHFQLDESKLRRISDVLRENAGKLSEETYLQYYIERENDSFYETKEIDEVLADDNVSGKSIRTISIQLLKLQPEKLESSKPEPDVNGNAIMYQKWE